MNKKAEEKVEEVKKPKGIYEVNPRQRVTLSGKEYPPGRELPPGRYDTLEECGMVTRTRDATQSEVSTGKKKKPQDKEVRGQVVKPVKTSVTK